MPIKRPAVDPLALQQRLRNARLGRQQRLRDAPPLYITRAPKADDDEDKPRVKRTSYDEQNAAWTFVCTLVCVALLVGGIVLLQNNSSSDDDSDIYLLYLFMIVAGAIGTLSCCLCFLNLLEIITRDR